MNASTRLEGFESSAEFLPTVGRPDKHAKDGVSKNLFELFQNTNEAQREDINDFNKWYNYDVINTDEKFSVIQNATPQNRNQGKIKSINFRE